VVLTREGAGAASSVSASLEVDQAQVNRLLLQLVRVSETHGIKFPREFGLFIKQLLYFDRYTRLLAPELQVLRDDRINIRGLSEQYGL
jgi:aarF domain-containing kinase